MALLDEECTPEDHDLTQPHIIIETVITDDGDEALRLCHLGYDPDDALVILKHVTTLLHQDLVAMYAKRN